VGFQEGGNSLKIGGPGRAVGFLMQKLDKNAKWGKGKEGNG